MLGEGIHRISMEDYCADPCPEASLSSGIIKTILFDTPAKAKVEHPRLNPYYAEKTDDKFDLGNAAHSLLLEGIDSAWVCDFPDWRTKEARAIKEQARKEGRTPLLQSQYEAVSVMVENAKTQIGHSELAIINLEAQGDSELTFIWKEDETWCRIRPDWINRDYSLCLNYKTTTSPNPNAFVRTVINLGYDSAEAFYRRGIKAVTGVESIHIFMVQSVEPPYLCSFIGLDPQFRAMGEAKVQQGIDVWRHCMATGDWPGYGNRIMWLAPPAYALGWQLEATWLPSQEEEDGL